MDDHFDVEEEFHSKESRKIYRKERRLASKKDRSKFKKTDEKKRKKPLSLSDDDIKRGRVLCIVPEGVIVDHEGQELLCTLKGIFKKEVDQVKNLIAVGDFVRFTEEGVITGIEERTSILSRADTLSQRKAQLLAVNVDQVLIVSSVCLPPLKPHLIDRYIIAAQKGNMRPFIVINKIDLFHDLSLSYELREKEEALLDELSRCYKQIGIPFFPVSANTQEGIELLKDAMRGKTSVLSGQSGAGKSSLINVLLGLSLKTGEVVSKTKKGAHTTTSARLIPIDGGGFCIDTPGVKSFGLWDLEPWEVQDNFPEIKEAARDCRFPDCAHLKEPDCSVIKKVEEGMISPLRFASYCALMASLKEEHRLR